MGDTVTVTLVVFNPGPDMVDTAQSLSHIVAPGGTELVGDFTTPQPPCQIIDPGHEVACPNGGQWWAAPDRQSEHGDVGYGWQIKLKIDSPDVTPGLFRQEYPLDPNTSNNSARIVVTVDGVTDPASAGPAGGATPTGGQAATRTATRTAGTGPVPGPSASLGDGRGLGLGLRPSGSPGEGEVSPSTDGAGGAVKLAAGPDLPAGHSSTWLFVVLGVVLLALGGGGGLLVARFVRGR